MRQFRIKQKFWSLGGKFTITDELGQPSYTVEGSFLQIPKSFVISDMAGREVGRIEKVLWSFLPAFEVHLSNGQSFKVKKELKFFKDRYAIENLGLEVRGDFWDMSFDLLRDGDVVASITQEWLQMTSTYNLAVYEDDLSDLVVSLAIAIDYVKEQQSNSNH